MASTWAALTTLRALTKVYEFSSPDASRLDAVKTPAQAGLAYPRQPLDVAVAATFPALLALAGRLEVALTTAPAAEPLHELHKLALKCFWSATQYAIPPALAEDGRLGRGWLDLVLHALRRRLPPPGGADGVDGDNDGVDAPSWKSRKWLLHILLRFARRYGDPTRTPDEQPAARAMATLFKGDYAPAATAAVRDMLLASVAPGGGGAAGAGGAGAGASAPSPTATMSPRVVSLALAFLEAAVGVAAMWAELRPAADAVVDTVVFPLLCFSDEDAATLEEDPLEYVRQQDELRSEDRYSPRLAAAALLHTLAALRVKAVVLPFLSRLLGQVLVPAAAATPGTPAAAAGARLKDGALMALGSVHGRLIQSDGTAGSLLAAVRDHVLPVVAPGGGDPPFLVARAAWLIGQFAAPEWSAFTDAVGVDAVVGLLGCLDHPSVAVRATAAAALLPYATVDAEAVIAHLRSTVPALLERLILLIDTMAGAGSDGAMVMETMERYMGRFADEVAPLVPALTQRLVGAFLRAAPSAAAGDGGRTLAAPLGGGIGAVDGDDDEEDDDDEMAAVAMALQALTAVNAGLAALASSDALSGAQKRAAFAATEASLLPALDGMFAAARQEMFEESLDVLSQLLYHVGVLGAPPSAALWSLFPRLAVALCAGWSADYVHHAVAPLDNWITFDWGGLVAPGRPFSPPLGAIAAAAAAGGGGVGNGSGGGGVPPPTSGRYLDVVVGLVVDFWTGAGRDEDDATCGCKVAQSLLLHGKRAGDGALDGAVTGALVPAVAARLPAAMADVPADDAGDEEDGGAARKLASALFSIVWATLWYDTRLAATALGGEAALGRLLAAYATLAGPSGAGVARVLDKKMAVVGLGSLLAASGGGGTHDLAVVRLGLVLVNALSRQRSTAADEAARGRSPFLEAAKLFGASAAGSGGDSDGDLADGEDAKDGLEERMIASLVAEVGGPAAAFRTGGGGGGGGGDADAAAALLEGFWGDDSEEDEGDYESPLDDLDEAALFGQAVRAVAARGEPAWWGGLSGGERAAAEALGAAAGGGA